MKTKLKEPEPKKYTLEEAYQIMLRIKNEMGIKEYQQMELNREFKLGYSKAISDMREEFNKRSGLLNSLNGF